MKKGESWDNIPLSAGIFDHTVDCTTNMTELEKDKPNKERLKRLINELLAIAKKYLGKNR